jgi:hypothetical protein
MICHANVNCRGIASFVYFLGDRSRRYLNWLKINQTNREGEIIHREGYLKKA